MTILYITLTENKQLIVAYIQSNSDHTSTNPKNGNVQMLSRENRHIRKSDCGMLAECKSYNLKHNQIIICDVHAFKF